MLNLLFLIVLFLYFLSILVPSLGLSGWISVLCMIIVLCTFFKTSRFVQVLGSIFLTAGAFLLWNTGVHWTQYILSFGPMLDLLMMFTLIPILGIPITLGRYSVDIQGILHNKIKTNRHLYMLTSGISYFFSIFMNLATLPMTYYSIKPALEGFPVQHSERFMSRAITRGFAMPLIWAPVTPIVGIVIGVTGVSWVSILPYVVPLSIFGLILDWYLGSRISKKRIQSTHAMDEMAATSEKEPSNPKRIFQILLAIIFFIVFVSVGETFLPYSFLTLVSLLVIPFSFAWSLLLKKGKEFGGAFRKHFQSFSNNMRDQFFLFLSAGFFISTIKISHSNELVNVWIVNLIGAIGTNFFLMLLPLIPLAFAFLGFHPAVTLALMAETLNPDITHISAHILTVAMLSGAASAFLIGPYNATIGLMSNIVKQSSYKVSNWNMPFTGIYIVCTIIYLLSLQWLT
ncbi:hypothetical protein D4T97_011410 [Siminovitchia acidinfaciens]|uniref:Uncharacterized protein n=1 Tax=Siminovitchia acidinfaciens TaxID=2321395 RepID=A0A429XZN6_9BACI|nr:hypothetical protein [Siminovitchia acidinfaciens]RST74274.1 hypothetical protein D4T97_011410 [Siminovitchia acidinfaciens]